MRFCVSLLEDEKDILRSWRQGDYTLDAREFPTMFVNEHGSMDVAWVEGWVVLTQTCDIVNFAEGRDLVAVAPLVKAKLGLMQAVAKGTTPAAAQLENSPGENLVVDLTKLCAVQKKALAGMRRAIGFSSDETRCTFAHTLERRYGRFAFPDALSDGPVIAIRNQSKDKHKRNSDSGRVYRSLRCIRVSASPDFNTRGAEIQFIAVLDEEARLEATTTEIKKNSTPSQRLRSSIGRKNLSAPFRFLGS